MARDLIIVLTPLADGTKVESVWDGEKQGWMAVEAIWGGESVWVDVGDSDEGVCVTIGNGAIQTAAEWRKNCNRPRYRAVRPIVDQLIDRANMLRSTTAELVQLSRSASLAA